MSIAAALILAAAIPPGLVEPRGHEIVATARAQVEILRLERVSFSRAGDEDDGHTRMMPKARKAGDGRILIEFT